MDAPGSLDTTQRPESGAMLPQQLSFPIHTFSEEQTAQQAAHLRYLQTGQFLTAVELVGLAVAVEAVAALVREAMA